MNYIPVSGWLLISIYRVAKTTLHCISQNNHSSQGHFCKIYYPSWNDIWQWISICFWGYSKICWCLWLQAYQDKPLLSPSQQISWKSCEDYETFTCITAFWKHNWTTEQHHFHGVSPAELLMGRRIRIELPQITQNFILQWSHTRSFKALDKQYKKLQKDQYDKWYRTRALPNLPDKQSVWVETIEVSKLHMNSRQSPVFSKYS